MQEPRARKGLFAVHEVSELAGVSIRTLQHYDNIGLLHPAQRNHAGYRLYDEAALEKLQQILLFRELEFPLKDIRRIIDSPDFDKAKALDQQLHLLTLKKEHLEKLIALARSLRKQEVGKVDFAAFDTSKLDEYAARAKAAWGSTPEYQEFEQKDRMRAPSDQKELFLQMMGLFVEFGAMKDAGASPQSAEVQAHVKKLQNYISEHFYQCSNEVLAGLGKMYASGGEFTTNIDAAAGAGSAQFAAQAIETYCAQ